MDLKTLTAKFSQKNKKLVKSTWVINPDVYWKSILFLSSGILALFFVFGFYLLNKVNSNDGVVESANLVRIDNINKDKLNKTIEYFSKREEVSKNIINLPSPVIDPSL